ncbi:MAG TPA: ATP-grasp fold amidoligase family protein [Anaerolineales bacterium]
MAHSLFDKFAPYLLKPLKDEQYVVLDHLWHVREWPHLNAPETISEKLTWLKLHYRDELARRCCDKYQVREFVRRQVSDEILVPLIAVYDAAEEIRFDNLPEAFILKATHGSGWNVVCRSLASFDRAAAVRTLSRYLRQDYFDGGREWGYKGLQPRIVCEQLLLDDTGEVPEDYKFFCFHGEPRLIQIDYDRFTSHRVDLYDVSWNHLACRRTLWPNRGGAVPPAPGLLQPMLRIAARLAQPFPFVRVDLYALRDRVYFGELSFYPGRGVLRHEPHSFDRLFGSYLHLETITEHLI